MLLLYYIFIKSYFSKKEKNLATKEDIGKITKEIELVKKEISIKTQAESEFIKERKESILKFNETISFFIDYTTKFVNVIANNQTNLELIRKEIESIRLQGAKLNSSFMKLQIYLEDYEILNSAKEYYNSAVGLQIAVVETLFEIEKSANEEKLLRDLFEKGQISQPDNLYEIVKNRKILIETHIRDRNNLLSNKIYKNRGLFITDISRFLKITTLNTG